MSHGAAETKRLDLCKLNPIYQRELISQMYARGGGGGMCLWTERGKEDVGIRKMRVASPGLRHTSLLAPLVATADFDIPH